MTWVSLGVYVCMCVVCVCVCTRMLVYNIVVADVASFPFVTGCSFLVQLICAEDPNGLPDFLFLYFVVVVTVVVIIIILSRDKEVDVGNLQTLF